MNRLVYILRENRGRIEELTGYWVTCGISLLIRIRLWALIDLTKSKVELNKKTLIDGLFLVQLDLQK